MIDEIFDQDFFQFVTSTEFLVGVAFGTIIHRLWLLTIKYHLNKQNRNKNHESSK